MQRIRHFYCFSVIATTVVVVTLFGPPVENSSYAADPGVEAALNLQNAFTKIAEDASDAVVVVTNKQVNRSPRSMQQIPPEFRFFFGLPEQREDQERKYEEVPRPAGRGSGFFIDEAGYIVTNYHVIKDHAALEVKLRDGKVYDTERNEDSIEVIGSDRETDLAVLKINDPEREDDFPVLEFADSKQIKVGQWAIAVGAPFNFDRSITVGVVSQKGRHDMRVNTYENYIQTDASINPGNP
ncbi:MAG: trypsin-like peptidase domain-containing protein [Lentisphaeria bacterium]